MGNEEKKKEEEGLRALNIWSKNVNWKDLLQELENTNWTEECREHDSIESTYIFYKILTKICEKNAPKKRKTNNNNNMEKEEIKTVKNKIKFLRRKKRKATTEERRKELEIRIMEVDSELIKERRVEKYERENKLKE